MKKISFLLPLLLERQFVRTDQWFDGRYDFHGHFVYVFQLFSPAFFSLLPEAATYPKP